jgi:hypothetical protein
MKKIDMREFKVNNENEKDFHKIYEESYEQDAVL